MSKRLLSKGTEAARSFLSPAKALVLIVALGVGGCAWVPDWANPVEWYDGVFGDDEAPPSQASRAPGSDRPFPQLSSVPQRPQTATPPEQARVVAQGLAADREQARYTDEVLRGRPASAAPLPVAPSPAPAPVRVATSSPPPAPAPSLLPQPRIVAAPATPSGARAPAPFPRLSPIVAAPPRPVPQPPVPPRPTVQSPRAAPAPAQFAALAPSARPMVSADQNILMQSFSAGLAASAATVITTPTHGNFDATTSQPFAPRSVPVDEVLRNNYNDALSRSPASISGTPAGSPPPRLRLGAGGGGVSTSASVKFSNGSAALSRAARSIIKGMARQYKERGGKVRVVGHASERTKDMGIARHKLLNFRLSADRAQAVAGELMRNGVKPSAIILESRGANDPVYHEWMPEGEAANRRADIQLVF